MRVAPLSPRTSARQAPRKPPSLPSDSALMLCLAFHSLLPQATLFTFLHSPFADQQLDIAQHTQLPVLDCPGTPRTLVCTHPSLGYGFLFPAATSGALSQAQSPHIPLPVKSESFGAHVGDLGRYWRTVMGLVMYRVLPLSWQSYTAAQGADITPAMS